MRFVLRLPSLRQLRRESMLPAILASVALHLGMVALGFAAMNWGSNSEFPLPVYTVSLVELPQPGEPPAGGSPAPPIAREEVPAASEPETDSALQAVPQVPVNQEKKKPEPAKKKAPPRKKPVVREVKQPQETTRPDTGPASPEAPVREDTVEQAPATGLTTSGEGSLDGVPTIDSEAFSFGYYRDILTNRLRSTWSRPLVPGGLQQAIRATVQFVVLRSGAITEVSVQESSNYPPLDRSALRSVFDANPLPPLPGPYEGDRLAVTFFFELTPER